MLKTGERKPELKTYLNASAASNFTVMFSCLQRFIKPIIGDAVDTQVRFNHRPAFSEDDHLRDEWYRDDIAVQLARQLCRLIELLALHQPEPARHVAIIIIIILNPINVYCV